MKDETAASWPPEDGRCEDKGVSVSVSASEGTSLIAERASGVLAAELESESVPEASSAAVSA